MQKEQKLHFVYNVDATPVALLSDFIHRLVDPATYPCKLCDLTYGRFVKKKSWRNFVAGLPIRSEFHLRSGFRRTHPDLSGYTLPAVFIERASGKVAVLISAAELGKVRDQTGLEKLVLSRVVTANKKRV